MYESECGHDVGGGAAGLTVDDDAFAVAARAD